MRKFDLWNSDRSANFNFAEEGVVITTVAGLGLEFSASFSDQAVVNYEREFEQISLLANFGVNKNAYTAFKNLADFINANGKRNLVLEYTVNDRTVYADVWLVRMPKTQKTNFNILSETLQFTRTTPWYTKASGTVTATAQYLSNTTITDIAVKISIRGATSSDFKLILKRAAASATECEIRLNNTLLSDNLLSIDAENKKVELKTISNGAVTNGYNQLNKAYDSFIVIPTGTFQIYYTGTAAEVKYEFKRWVID